MFETLLNKGTEVYEKIGNKASEIKGNLLDFIPEADYDYISNTLLQLGYKVPKIEIKLSIPPSISLEIDLDNSLINELEKKQIENSIEVDSPKETETNKILFKILQGLEYAAKVNKKVKLSNKRLSRVIVEASLIPSVKLVYLDEEVIASSYLRDENLK